MGLGGPDAASSLRRSTEGACARSGSRSAECRSEAVGGTCDAPVAPPFMPWRCVRGLGVGGAV